MDPTGTAPGTGEHVAGSPLLSLGLITRDEAENLERCLASVRGIVDEVVVVDTGSTDGTVRLARRLGARVWQVPWQEDFSRARNEVLARAAGEWVLTLDADEELDRGSGAGLRELLAATDEPRFSVEVVSLMGDGSQRQRSLLTRLFRRQGHAYAGRVHEQLLYRGRPAPPGRWCGLRVVHYGYLAQSLRARDKFRRNLSLLLREWRERPDAYLAHQIGMTHYAAGDLALALAWFERARDLRGGYDARLLKDTAYCLKDLGRTREALALVAEGIRAFPDYTDLHFLRGTLCLELGLVAQAEAAFRSCLERGEAPPRYQSVEGVGSHLAHYNLGVIYEVTGDRARAATHYRAAAASGYGPAAARLEQLTGVRPWQG